MGSPAAPGAPLGRIPGMGMTESALGIPPKASVPNKKDRLPAANAQAATKG
jgi:hypothetical protein